MASSFDIHPGRIRAATQGGAFPSRAAIVVSLAFFGGQFVNRLRKVYTKKSGVPESRAPRQQFRTPRRQTCAPHVDVTPARDGEPLEKIDHHGPFLFGPNVGDNDRPAAGLSPHGTLLLYTRDWGERPGRPNIVWS